MLAVSVKDIEDNTLVAVKYMRNLSRESQIVL